MYKVYKIYEIWIMELNCFFWHFFDITYFRVFLLLFYYFYFFVYVCLCFWWFCIINGFVQCVYRIRCRFLYIWRYFTDNVLHFGEKCPRSVNKFRTNDFVVNCCDLGGLKWSPPPPSPASMSKFPSRETIWKKKKV